MFTLPKRARPLPDRVAVAAHRVAAVVARLEGAVVAARLEGAVAEALPCRVAAVAAHPEQVAAEAAVPQCHHPHLMGSTPIA